MTNSTRTNVTIRGVLRLSSLTHQTAAGGKGTHMKTRFIANSEVMECPMITANSVRGLLRRAAADVLLAVLEKQVAASALIAAQDGAVNKKISRDLYLSIVRGAASRTSINKGGSTFQEAKAAKDHIFAGLFGGGSSMFDSRFRMENDLLPILESTKSMFPASVHGSAINVFPRDLLVQSLSAPRDDFERLPSRNVVDDLEQAYNDHMSKKIVQRSEKQDNKAEIQAARDESIALASIGEKPVKTAAVAKVKIDDLNNFIETECMIAGTPLYFSASLTNVTPAQVGLFLQALHAWVNRNTLGGGGARGRGAFAPDLALIESGQVITDTMFYGHAPTAVMSENPRIAEFLAAAASELEAACDPGVLEFVYPCTPVISKEDQERLDAEKKEKAAQKKAAKAAAKQEALAGA